MEGCRRDSFVYVCDGQIYTKIKEKGGITKLRCRQHGKGGCEGTAIINAFNTLHITRNHNHDKSFDEAQIYRLKHELRATAGRSNESARNIYDTVTAEFPEEIKAKVRFSPVRFTIDRIKKSTAMSEDRCGICLEDIEEDK